MLRYLYHKTAWANMKNCFYGEIILDKWRLGAGCCCCPPHHRRHGKGDNRGLWFYRLTACSS